MEKEEDNGDYQAGLQILLNWKGSYEGEFKTLETAIMLWHMQDLSSRFPKQ